MVCDVAEEPAATSFVTEAARTMGGLDIVVNNAGIDGPAAPLDEISPDDWIRTFVTGQVLSICGGLEYTE